MNRIVLLLSFLLFSSCSSYKQIEVSNGYYKYINSNIPPKPYFYLPEKYVYIKKSNYGNILNQHFTLLSNPDLDELQIGMFALGSNQKNGVLDETAFIENFKTELAWLNQDKSIYENGLTDEKSYLIYNVKNNTIEHTILFGTKENFKIYIQLDNPKSSYVEEVDKVKAIFNKIKQ
jgi:hypothetical protein